jgi:hypothetical protein
MANNNNNIRSGDVQQQQPFHQAPEPVQVMHNFLQNFFLVSKQDFAETGFAFCVTSSIQILFALQKCCSFCTD